MHIKEVRAHIIKNSRGEKAIEIIVNKKYKASAASGASTGKHEVPCFSSQGIEFSVTFINKHHHFKNFSLTEFSDLAVFDSFIPLLGGNAVVALQGACLQAMAHGNVAPYLSSRLRFPVPLGNCVGGGAHSKGIGTDIQEFLILQKTNENVFLFLSQLLDEIKKEGYSVQLGVDVAASQFYKKGKYSYMHSSLKKNVLSKGSQIHLVNNWIQKYHLSYVEDPLQEEDFSGFSRIHKGKNLICCDDLVTTNIERLQIALKKRSVNSIIVKPNQIGSLIKTKEIVDFCKKKGIATIISHRSGETMDTLIADLAAAWHIPYIKTGIFGKEREAKLRRLIDLEKH